MRGPRPGSPAAAATCRWPSAWSPGTSGAPPAGPSPSTPTGPPSARRAARTRLFDYYLATAAAAVDALFPAEAYHRPRIPPPGTPTPELADLGAAVGWLDSERPALVAVAEQAAAHGWPAHAVR